MTNIPTDLLRTFVAVVDNRSFTKAAISLGVTQPAVSAQIKRLQSLLGVDVFDRSTQGVTLTAQGETVVNFARRMLVINDQIVQVNNAGQRPELTIRVGTSSDYAVTRLPEVLANFRGRYPQVRFKISGGYADTLMRQLRNGDIDIFVGLSTVEPRDAHESWTASLVWVRGADTRFEAGEPVPLVSYGEPSVYYRAAVRALRAANLEWEETFTGAIMTDLTPAIDAGLGVMPMTQRRAIESGMIIADDLPLPPLDDVYAGIYLREGGPTEIYEALANDIVGTLSQLGAESRSLVAEESAA